MQFYTEEGMTIAGVIVLVALAGYDGLTPREGTEKVPIFKD